jgi:hypothetical protein
LFSRTCFAIQLNCGGLSFGGRPDFRLFRSTSSPHSQSAPPVIDGTRIDVEPTLKSLRTLAIAYALHNPLAQRLFLLRGPPAAICRLSIPHVRRISRGFNLPCNSKNRDGRLDA